MTPFGLCLVDILREKNMSQSSLAKAMNIQRSRLSMILNGSFQNQPKQIFLSKMFKAIEFNDQEKIRIEAAAAESTRLLLIPAKAPARYYRVAHQIMRAIRTTDDKKLKKVMAALED